MLSSGIFQEWGCGRPGSVCWRWRSARGAGLEFSGLPPSHSQASLILSHSCLCPNWSLTLVYQLFTVMFMYDRYVKCQSISNNKTKRNFILNMAGMLLGWMVTLIREAALQRGRTEEKDHARLNIWSLTNFFHTLLFQCDICQKNLKRGEKMSQHVASHQLEKPLECIYPGCREVSLYIEYKMWFQCLILKQLQTAPTENAMRMHVLRHHKSKQPTNL